MISAENRKIICDELKIEPRQLREYPSSYVRLEEAEFLLCKADNTKKILATGKGDFFSQLDGMHLSATLKLCPLTHQNRLVLNKYLPYTLPTAFGSKTATFGLGDRLGLASPGHIRCFGSCSAKPVLAQQSRRELDLTGRTYAEVLDDVCFSVFQEGYRGGFGADGDHLKNIKDIEDALSCGYTMITLDCSEKIGRGIGNLSDEELTETYQNLPTVYRQRIEASYLSKGFPIENEEYHFSREELMRCALIYSGAVDFTRDIYFQSIRKSGQPVDFELSIDETESVTTSQGHLFVAMELGYNKIDVASLAPRFVGEFQKGIDYIGDIGEFEIQLKQHAAIARHFGYKLSIHSGSDKFSVFPIIGKYTGGILHLKTSGTSWLEAVGAIAETNPLLYRKLHQKAMESFNEAKSFYHVSGDPGKVQYPACREDIELVDYLKDDNARQLLHITYGFILEDPELKNELYQTLKDNEDCYYGRLITHIRRHLETVGLSK